MITIEIYEKREKRKTLFSKENKANFIDGLWCSSGNTFNSVFNSVYSEKEAKTPLPIGIYIRRINWEVILCISVALHKNEQTM